MMLEGGATKWVGFVGSTDLKALLGSLPLPPPTDKGNGAFEIMSPYGPIRIVQQGAWAIFTNDAELLKSVPADPTQLLGGLEKEYGAAIRLNMQNVPAETRDQFIGIMKFSAEAGLQKKPGEEDSDFEMRKGATEAILKGIEKIAHDLDQLTVGLAIDTEGKSVHADVAITFVAGSEMAKAANEKTSGKSDFAGFLLPGAAFNFNLSEKLGPDDIASLSEMLKTSRTKVQAQLEKDPSLSDEATKKAAKDLVDQLFDIGDAAAKSGKLDAGAALMLDPKALTFAAGGAVPDGAAVEKAFRKFVELGKVDPNFPPVKFDVEKYKDVRFHTMAIPMNDPQGKQFFGETLDVYLVVGEHSAYVAFGKGSIDLLKKVIDKSAADVTETLPPFQANVALTPIVDFVNTVQPGNPAVGMISQILAGTAGKDHLKIHTKTVENGGIVRIEAEEGVLKVFGMAAKMGGPHQ